jgi:CRISPR-associated protein Cmr1
MRYLLADFEIVTPLFMGGADPAHGAELRIAGIKGALRFWWRALHAKLPLEDLHARECHAFGSAGNASGRSKDEGQSKVVMHLRHSGDARLVPALKNSPLSDLIVPAERTALPGAAYFGYGCMSFNGTLQRPCFRPGGRFSLGIRCDDDSFSDIRDALRALGLFGGLGSCSRRGYGGIHLSQIEEILPDHERRPVWSAPQSLGAYKTAVDRLLERRLASPKPDYSGFSAATRIDVLAEGAAWHTVLDDVGRAMIRYRSYGRTTGHGRRVLGRKAEERFKQDHIWTSDKLHRRATKMAHPERIVFGLPHNHYFSDGTVVGISARDGDLELRRASPLLIQIRKIGLGFVAIAVLLEARYLPDTATLHVEKEKMTRADLGDVATIRADYGVINRFLDDAKYFAARRSIVRPGAPV